MVQCIYVRTITIMWKCACRVHSHTHTHTHSPISYGTCRSTGPCTHSVKTYYLHVTYLVCVFRLPNASSNTDFLKMSSAPVYLYTQSFTVTYFLYVQNTSMLVSLLHSSFPTSLTVEQIPDSSLCLLLEFRSLYVNLFSFYTPLVNGCEEH